jgi:hypothetical protein
MIKWKNGRPRNRGAFTSRQAAERHVRDVKCFRRHCASP